MGDLFRKVTDIQTFGAAPIKFTRFFNSRTTTFNSAYWDFGAEQTWQHSWNYEVRQLSTKTFGFFDIKVRYPNGAEQNFKATDATGLQLAPAAKWGDRLYRWSGSTVGYTLVTPSGKEYYFWRYLSPKFKLTEVHDGHGLVWTLTYDTNDKIQRITNPFGKWLEITRATVNGIECITQVATSDGRSVSYGYTAYAPTSTSVLTSVTYPGGEVAAYTWTGASSATTGRPMLETASDPLYGGAGARVKYVWNYNQIFDFGAGPYLVTGTILEERNLDTDKVIVSFPYGTGSNPVILEGNGTQVGSKFVNSQIAMHWDGEGRVTTYGYDAGGWGPPHDTHCSERGHDDIHARLCGSPAHGDRSPWAHGIVDLQQRRLRTHPYRQAQLHDDDHSRQRESPHAYRLSRQRLRGVDLQQLRPAAHASAQKRWLRIFHLRLRRQRRDEGGRRRLHLDLHLQCRRQPHPMCVTRIITTP